MMENCDHNGRASGRATLGERRRLTFCETRQFKLDQMRDDRSRVVSSTMKGSGSSVSGSLKRRSPTPAERVCEGLIRKWLARSFTGCRFAQSFANSSQMLFSAFDNVAHLDVIDSLCATAAGEHLPAVVFDQGMNTTRCGTRAWRERANCRQRPVRFLWRGPPTYDPLLVYRPRTWLLREGWKKHGATISCRAVPSMKQ